MSESTIAMREDDPQSSSLRLSEIYSAEQGEGLYAGVPSVFVRTTGCNLRCWFCDTPHTSWNPEGEVYTLDSILERIETLKQNHVVVTGGEPLTQPAIVPLTRQLRDSGKYVTIETAGTIFRPVHADLISISPKLSNSTPDESSWKLRHDQLRHDPRTIESFRDKYTCQWKFVIDASDDLGEVEEYVRSMQLDSRDIWLMAQARSAEELSQKNLWLQAEAESRGWKLSPRLHIAQHGNLRGT